MEASARVNSACVGSLDEGVPTPYWLPTEVVLSHRESKVGDVVIVIDLSAARREWKVGRIECTYPGSDQLVRVVDVQVRDKFLKRSVTRISLLEFAKTDSDI